MKGLRFLDFDLTFQRTANGYRAQVLGSPAGQASVEFVLPFKEFEIENFLLRFGRPRQPVRGLASSQLGEARSFGSRLFEAAFSGEVRSCLRSSLDEAQRQDLGLRIRLRLTDAPELNDLPWEFLLYPSRDRFLALSAETPLVRYLELSERIRPLEVKPPLKVLTVISSPTDYPPLDVESERRKLQESMAELQERNLLVLSRLESPTLPDLQRWLRRETCHIFHFIGHGGFNSRTEDGLLLFMDEKGRGREVTGQTLGTLLHDHRPLRLAVLNACEGARTSLTDPFAGVAQSLVQQGIPAVVAMQFEITDKAAITFSQELYAAVVDGYPVDAALAEARKALFLAGHELEWGTPVLYMRSPDGRIFDIASAVAAAKPEQSELRPASAEAKPAPTAPKAPLPEAAAAPPPVLKEYSVETTRPAGPKAASARLPISPAEPKSAKAPPAVPKEYTVEVTRPGAPKAASTRPQTPLAEPKPKPTEAKTGKAPRLVTSQELSHARQASRMPVWIGLIALLGLAIFIATRLFSGNGESEVQVPTPVLPARVIQEPAMEREEGIYLRKRARKGEKIKEPMLEIVGESQAPNEPRILNDVHNGCFARDLEAGHKLAWGDYYACS